MRQVVVIAFVAAALSVPAVANAGERVFDGALGAASGALVGGPVGFVAGGAVGFFAGPHISRGMGFHRHYRQGYRRHAAAPRDLREAGSDSR